MLLRLAFATLLSGVAVSAAQASTITVTNGSSSASVTAISAAGISAPFTLANFGNAGTNGLVSAAPVTFAGGAVSFASGKSPPSGVYDGSVLNVASSPYAGTSLPSANYLVAEVGGGVTVSYTAPQSVLNLLWGTVDNYDNLNVEFLNGSTVVGSVTLNGTQIASAAGIAINGTAPAYVTITPGGSLSSFNTIVATATDAAFEFNIGTASAVPEPATFALLATGLIGLGLLRARRT